MIKLILETDKASRRVNIPVAMFILFIAAMVIALVDRFGNDILSIIWMYGWVGLLAVGIFLIVLGAVGLILHFFPGERTKNILRSLGERGID